MSQTSELLPCPFCGSVDVMPCRLRSRWPIVECQNCLAEAAKDAWNTRTPDQAEDHIADERKKVTIGAVGNVGSVFKSICDEARKGYSEEMQSEIIDLQSKLQAARKVVEGLLPAIKLASRKHTYTCAFNSPPQECVCHVAKHEQAIQSAEEFLKQQ